MLFVVYILSLYCVLVSVEFSALACIGFGDSRFIYGTGLKRIGKNELEDIYLRAGIAMGSIRDLLRRRR